MNSPEYSPDMRSDLGCTRDVPENVLGGEQGGLREDSGDDIAKCCVHTYSLSGDVPGFNVCLKVAYMLSGACAVDAFSICMVNAVTNVVLHADGLVASLAAVGTICSIFILLFLLCSFLGTHLFFVW